MNENTHENIIFNYSSINITDPMKNLLNRGLNFSILPQKLDITEVFSDLKRFERIMIWQEYWYGKESIKKEGKPIFYEKKTNMPKGHHTPQALKNFITSVKSELRDPKNRNEEKCNLPKSELEALKLLIELQKQRKIIIKQCDKGAGIMLFNFKDYMKASYEHLLSKQPNTDERYYTEIDDIELLKAQKNIKEVLDRGLKEEIITKSEYNAMNPEEKNPAKFYCIPKVHKDHTPPQTPPVRPIISGTGSITENLGIFVEHHVKVLATKHQSYLQDTPHLLRIIEKLNDGKRLPENTILATCDIVGAYQNIPHDDGLDCFEEILEERLNKEIPSSFIKKLMELIQKENIFEFHDALWKQTIGTAMGSHPAPSYANMYLSKRIDNKIVSIAKKLQDEEKGTLKLFKRFLDDLLKVFIGTSKELHVLFDKMNEIHNTLKFTLNHTSIKNENINDRCNCEEKYSIPFLDTSLSIKNGKMEVDLYKKPTDRNQYLLPSSCHPKETTTNLPFSAALRIVRICTSPENRDFRLQQLKHLLLKRDYNEDMVNRAITKARNIKRKYALKKSNKKENKIRPIFATKYDPRLPSLTTIQNKHWRSMVKSDQHLAKVFPEPPMTAYRKQRNIKDFLIRSKVASQPKKYTERKQYGMYKCEKSCPSCPYIKIGKTLKINENENWRISQKVNCETFNCIYIIECQKPNCHKRYIGQTKRKLKNRIADHRGYVSNQVLSTPTGEHFNLPGHCLADMKVSIIEQVKQNDEYYRKERESYCINKFNTFYEGLNREK